jgi:transcriptional regulator with XRE-family HTH domain
MNLSGLCTLPGARLFAMTTIVPSQCWLARDALGWTATDLARAAGLSFGTVQRFEGGVPTRPRTLDAIQDALENAGITFVDASEGGPGVRLRSKYTFNVVRSGSSLGFWEREIHREGKPLPVRLREDGYKTKRAAKSAGKAALRDFLAGLARDESKRD